MLGVELSGVLELELLELGLPELELLELLLPDVELDELPGVELELLPGELPELLEASARCDRPSGPQSSMPR